MSSGGSARIESVALWTPALPDWQAARAAFRCLPPAGQAHQQQEHQQQQRQPTAAAGAAAPVMSMKPPATMLAANERRRAPDSVLMGLDVALAAATAAGRAPAELASVFVSAHGDLAITDALCRTLADAPQLLSPTRFHHSVHNAVSGYWAIAGGSHAASTALSAHGFSFGAGLMEALCQCTADAAPVLLVAYDTAACGPLASVNGSRGWLAVAMVIAPGDAPEHAPGHAPTAGRRLAWSLQAGTGAATPLRSTAAQALSANAMAGALPLCEALAFADAADVALPLSDRLRLQLRLAAA